MEGLNIIFCEIKELVGANASGSINLARAPSLIRLPCQPQEPLNFLVVKKLHEGKMLQNLSPFYIKVFSPKHLENNVENFSI